MKPVAVIHFEAIILPAILEYEDAERYLTRTIVENAGDAELDKARYVALRSGGMAALYLHYFADIVAKQPPDYLPNFQGSGKRVRKWLSGKNLKLAHIDLFLLREAAEAQTHAALNKARLPAEAGQVLVIDRPSSRANLDDAKHDGMEQVWILSRSGNRTLSSVLETVCTLWTLALQFTP